MRSLQWQKENWGDQVWRKVDRSDFFSVEVHKKGKYSIVFSLFSLSMSHRSSIGSFGIAERIPFWCSSCNSYQLERDKKRKRVKESKRGRQQERETASELGSKREISPRHTCKSRAWLLHFLIFKCCCVNVLQLKRSILGDVTRCVTQHVLPLITIIHFAFLVCPTKLSQTSIHNLIYFFASGITCFCRIFPWNSLCKAF